MTCQQLIEAMAAKGYWTSPGGKTPAATLYSAMLREITAKGAAVAFRRLIEASSPETTPSYLIIDVWQWRRWCEPFVWIGLDALTIYLMANVVRFPQLAERLVGGNVQHFLNEHAARCLGDLTVALTGLALAVRLMWFLYRRRRFLRV